MRPPPEGGYINFNESLAHWVFCECKPLIVQDIESDPRIRKPNHPKYGSPSFMILPVFVRGQLKYILNLSHKATERPFDCNDEFILSIMIGEIGFALHNAGLYSEVEKHLKSLKEHSLKLTFANEKLQQKIRAHQRAEKAVSESKEKYRSILANIQEGYFEVDTAGNLTFLNDAHCRITGYSQNELIGMNHRIYTSLGVAEKLDQMFNQLCQTQKPARWLNYQIVRKDGSKRILELSASLIESENGQPAGFRCVVRDVTEQIKVDQEKRKLETKLIQAQKMEAIGTLAGGITHDFNNILAAIIGYTELAMLDEPEESGLRLYLEKIRQAGQRAKELVNHILAFSRQNKQERKPVCIGTIVKEGLVMLRASLPTIIKIRQRIEAETGMANTNPTQIHQVLMNLCINAAHSLNEAGGVIEVALAGIEIDTPTASRYPALRPGPYLKLTVSDTGSGVAPDVLNYIFDPYFTTKKKGEGTGLGLTVTHEIVKSHGGIITVESKVKGTSFHVYLPRVEHREAIAETGIKEALPLGSEKILFIDDEQSLVDIGRQMLEYLGYKVTARTSSVEALKLFAAQPDRFDLVITDMTMPNMTGEKLAIELMKIRNDIPIIICTGFSEKITAEYAKTIGIKEFAMKPLLMQDLGKSIRKVLAA